MSLLQMLRMRSQRMLSQPKRQNRYDHWRPLSQLHAMSIVALLFRAPAGQRGDVQDLLRARQLLAASDVRAMMERLIVHRRRSSQKALTARRRGLLSRTSCWIRTQPLPVTTKSQPRRLP